MCPLKVRTSTPVAASHSLAVPSSPPVSTYFPSGEKATLCLERFISTADRTAVVCPLKVRTSTPVAASHSFAVLSWLPVSTYFPSGEKATLSTQPVCPLKVRTSTPVAASHSFAVSSWLAVRTYFPSGERVTPSMVSVCPMKVRVANRRGRLFCRGASACGK